MEPLKKIFFVISLLCYLSWGVSLSAKDTHPVIRVAILPSVDDIILSARGKYAITDVQTGEELLSGRRLRRSRVLYHDGLLHIGKFSTPAKNIRITTNKDVRVQTPKVSKRYRQEVRIAVRNDEKLMLVNHLDLESYVKGVLYHEVTDRWPMEALKAQAVAARTYALSRMQENKDLPFDVRSDIYSQVYGGRSAERYRTNLAVDRTHREILKFEGEVFPTYFHSNSGGHTAAAQELGWENIAPLTGVKDDFAKGMPGYNWKRNFRSGDIQKQLLEKGLDVGVIKDIRIISRTSSGRAGTLQIISRKGKVTRLPASKFRSIIGPNVLRSTLFDIEMKGWFFDVIGRGWGHGVGMCQWGAHAFAKKRAGYEQILQYYYPGSELVPF